MRTVPGGQKGRMDVTDQRTSPSIASIPPWGTPKFFIPISLVLLTYLSPLFNPSVSKHPCAPHVLSILTHLSVSLCPAT